MEMDMKILQRNGFFAGFFLKYYMLHLQGYRYITSVFKVYFFILILHFSNYNVYYS